MEWINILPNLSIGVIAVLSLVYIVIKFLEALKEERKALREVEKDVRENLVNQMAENTSVMREANQTIQRAIAQLDKK